MPARALDGQVFFRNARQLTEVLLDRYLPSAQTHPHVLHEAMRYSVMAGGKRLRPSLALAAYEYCGGHPSEVDDPIHFAMAGLEVVHTYSLIHDDLPCMDDDDLRRGMPTCHKKYGEAVAVLAGDALHVIAFDLMTRTGSLATVQELAQAVGTAGMIGGQIADVEAEGKPVSREDVIFIHTRKTGALLRACVRIGAILAGADAKALGRLSLYGEKIGLAFQIIDDILDVEGDQEKLGKEVGSDCKNQKATYPGSVGVPQARKDATQLIDDALACFDPYEDNVLKYMARFIGQREQ